MAKVWQEKTKSPADFLEKMASYDEVVARLLFARGVKTPEEAETFLKPRYEDGYDPFLLTDMDKAVQRIVTAVANNEQITVYADYDADAVTAAATVLRFFKEVGFNQVDYYIPDRFSEGYGVSSQAIKELAEKGTRLIITVDTGTNAVGAIAEAALLGVDVIVTDHHQVNAELPKAYAIVNPHRDGDDYPFKSLTGVGVAFKLVQALIKQLATGDQRLEIPPEGWEKWLLDMVAIGTIADFQSLLGENRILVKWGMLVLGKSRWIGLRKLIEVAEIEGKKVDAYMIGFQIAPRINAAGRIQHAGLALDLLLTDDPEEAAKLSYKLNELNAKRQNLTDQILSEAREQIAKQHEKKIRFAYDKGWPLGILGLVAGRLSQEFHRPVLVMSIDDGEITGSARSVEGFNIVEALKSADNWFEKYGGHDQAAGFSFAQENLENLQKALLEYAEDNLSDELLSPVRYYDSELALPKVNEKLVDTLEQFEPVGAQNPKPQFRINNLEPKYPSAIGADGKHLRFYVGEKAHSFSCIGFGFGRWAEKLLQTGQRIDILCEPQYNEWNGQKKIQLRIVDIKFSKNE